MKLFGLFVAAATAETDRVFSDNPAFITGEVGAWWTASPNVPANNAKNIRDQTELYFNTFVANPTTAQARVASTMKRLLDTQMDQNEKAASNCGGRNRNRRSGERKWDLDVNGGNKVAMEDMFWHYAYWTRNELQADCPKQAQRLLKRLDRLRLIWFWQTCDKEIDPTGEQCSWSGDSNPRFNNKFDKDDNTPFIAVGCQGADAELVCPYGGTVTVLEAAYGRKNKQECRKNAVGNKWKCWGKTKDDLTSAASTKCDGSDSCSYGYENADLCPNTDKYVRVEYTCQ